MKDHRQMLHNQFSADELTMPERKFKKVKSNQIPVSREALFQCYWRERKVNQVQIFVEQASNMETLGTLRSLPPPSPFFLF